MAGGGTERVIAVLSNYFAKQNKKVTILLTASGRIEYELEPLVEVIQLGDETGGKLVGRLQRIWKLRKYIKKNRDSFFLSFGTETNMFAIVSSMFIKRKLVISERSDPNKCSFSGKRDFLYKFADRFVFQTDDAKSCFSKQIQAKSIVIPNPIPDNVPSRFEGKRRKEIVAVGRLEEVKNHRLLIAAYSDFLEKFPEYKLKIYGKGTLKQELVNYADELGIKEIVCFADFDENVLTKIRDSYMFVLSSDYEGLSNSLLEALAMGLPVIATDCPIGGAKMVIQNYVNGILVPIKDREALANAMIELASEETLCEKLSKRAAVLKDEYSVEKIAGMWEKIFD